MQAIEVVKDRSSKEPDAKRTAAFMEATRDEGLLLGKAGLRDNVVRFGPSLLATEEEVEDCLRRVASACSRVDAGAPA